MEEKALDLMQVLAKILEASLTAAQKGGEFVVAQLPDIAQQYILYQMIYRWGWVSLGVLLIVATVVYVKKVGLNEKYYIKQYGKLVPSDWQIGTSLIGGLFVSILSCTLIGTNLREAILATFAPKILLIEWAASFIKG